MSYQRMKFRLTGVSPLVKHNGRLANPWDPMAKALKAVAGERAKTDADFEELARIEFLGGLYVCENGPCIPGFPRADRSGPGPADVRIRGLRSLRATGGS